MKRTVWGEMETWNIVKFQRELICEGSEDLEVESPHLMG